ncbi:MAG TPA: hypothetical protein VIP46_21250 [Pyrinomonadaceae bacterium]
MKQSGEPQPADARARERGGSRLNFLLVMAVIAALVYVGGQYVPARYRAWRFERFMQETVEDAVASGKTPTWVEQQFRQNFEEHGLPEDATVEVGRDGRRMKASVRYATPISLLVTEYEYDFDVSVRSVRVATGQ